MDKAGFGTELFSLTPTERVSHIKTYIRLFEGERALNFTNSTDGSET